MMLEEELLNEILRFCERKRKNHFTPEEFLIYLWYRRRDIVFETILRKLRLLAKKGLLARVHVKEDGEPIARRVIYIAKLRTIESKLKALEDAGILYTRKAYRDDPLSKWGMDRFTVVSLGKNPNVRLTEFMERGGT